MNYTVEYAVLTDGEWIGKKYQVMSAGSLPDLAQRFHQMYSRDGHRILRAIWHENGNRHEKKAKDA